MRLLNSCSRMGMEEALYLNGMGCIHYRLKLHRNASFYFARARADRSVVRSRPSLCACFSACIGRAPAPLPASRAR